MDDISKSQLQDLQDSIEAQEPVPIGLHLTQKGFDFVTSQLRILDKERYKLENGIQIVNKHSTLGQYQARVIMSNNSSKLISLREEI